MHIHTTSATPIGDSLAGFQAAQTATALRRARELSDAAARLRARSSVGAGEEDTVSFASLMAANPAAQSQTIAAVAGREPEESASAQEQESSLPARGSSASPQGLARSPLEPLELRTATQGGLQNSGFESSDVTRSVSFFSRQEPSRDSIHSPGKSGDPSKDWLRPVSFWA